MKHNYVYLIRDDIIEVVSGHVYLGVSLNYNNEFVNAMKKLLNQG